MNAVSPMSHPTQLSKRLMKVLAVGCIDFALRQLNSFLLVLIKY
jgi:hypothetical protein